MLRFILCRLNASRQNVSSAPMLQRSSLFSYRPVRGIVGVSLSSFLQNSEKSGRYMRVRTARVFLAFLFTLIFGGSVLCGSTAMAQTAATSQTDRIAALEKRADENAAAIAAAQTAGDNGWMLVSAALVLMMSGPGLA